MLTASARPDPNAPFARAEIIVRGLPAAPSKPAFQLRRSTVDYVEPNLDLTGWTRTEVTLRPLDAWWAEADRSFHFLVSGLLCQFIDPGPLKLRLPGQPGGEADLFWPEDISVYDDGNLAAHARVLTDTVRVVATEPTATPPAPPSPPPPPSPSPPPPQATPPPASNPSPNPWAVVTPPPIVEPSRWRGISAILLPITIGAAVIGAVATRYQTGIPPGRLPPVAAPRHVPPDTLAAHPRPPDTTLTLRAALDRAIGDMPGTRHAEFDPFLALRPPNEIISRTSSPEALVRYGVTKLDQREPVAADRLFEEATRPRFGPAQNRPYSAAFIVRGLLYDPSIQHDMILPVPNAGFAETMYRRAISSGDSAAAADAGRDLQRLTAWQAQHPQH